MNKKRPRDRKSVTIHVRVDGTTAKSWAARAKRSGAASTSDYVRTTMDPVAIAVKDAGPEGLYAAVDAARNAKGDTLLVLVSERHAERLHLALLLAEAYCGVYPANPLAERYAELSK